ncbi:methionyl-tRNA formyltransferase [Nitrolancea hollandica]|uniref:Methionyl-tRNA formyltransferase n=1 Tax=Nitrolancea hollandica Lb TaxID=1129897 RepID=I4EFW8_9BACT|nr:methionyl-tRNA formyltransferase [Nitrolancea hollandica]CCF83580.1 Methionyl-tRNA formyltransferase [Nitrolancea hollandica Lb]
MPIDVVFFGSPEFAVPALNALARDSRFNVLLAVTQPDRPAGRGKHFRPPAVKLAAAELGIPVWQPESLRSPEAVAFLNDHPADLYVVSAYGEIFRREVLALPAHGVLNIHPSLLPRYRGSSPVQEAIMNGESETGVSIIQMVRKLDSGPILAQSVVPLSGTETAGRLGERLAEVSGRMLGDVAADWVAGKMQARPQVEELATYTRELTKAEGRIDWRRPAEEIERRRRAMSPWPGAWTMLDGKRLKVLELDISREQPSPPGTITRTGNAILVGTGTSPIRLLRVQPEGRREVDATEWYRGAHLSPEARFDISTDDGVDR